MSTELIHVGEMKIWGAVVPVALSPKYRWFQASYGGRDVRAESWAELEPRVKDLIRKSRVKLAIRFLDPETGRVGTATGLHASRRAVRVEWEDGGTEYVERVGDPLRPDADFGQLSGLIKARDAASKAILGFIKEHRLSSTARDLRWVVENELDRLAKEASE